VWWVEAQDKGDPKTAAEHRDVLYTQELPFADTQPRELARTEWRFSGVSWADEGLALVREAEYKTRRARTWQVEPASGRKHASPLLEYSIEDSYLHPGSPMTCITASGAQLLRRDAHGRLFYSGTGGSEAGDRPFIDIRGTFPPLDESTKEGGFVSATNAEAARLWRCAEGEYESSVVIVPNGRSDGEEETAVLLTTRETKIEVPQLLERKLVIPAPSRGPVNLEVDARATSRQLSDFEHPQPQLLGVTKELIKYKRELDGVDLSGMLYTPRGYDAQRDGPLPAILWAYPREFKSADFASQVKGSPHRFVRVSATSPLLFLARGYAVLDNPSMPIIGVGDAEENDSFIPQLVASAEAAVTELQRRGVTDERVAVGGHSYGAFMSANLLAHSTVFKAGVGRSGAYNRLFTPFGFQGEERTLWDAPEVYLAMSPFLAADKIKAPFLLIHGAEDNNPGTFPMQSERLYQALKGHGREARLVVLPLESHGYQAKESVLHMLQEMDVWLKAHLVKDAPADATKE